MFKDKYNLINYVKAYFILLFILILINSSSDKIKKIYYWYLNRYKTNKFFLSVFFFELYFKVKINNILIIYFIH